MMFEHEITVVHRRSPFVLTLSEVPRESRTEVEASSQDLTEAWREALSRMPNDLYGALREAMREAG